MLAMLVDVPNTVCVVCVWCVCGVCVVCVCGVCVWCVCVVCVCVVCVCGVCVSVCVCVGHTFCEVPAATRLLVGECGKVTPHLLYDRLQILLSVRPGV